VDIQRAVHVIGIERAKAQHLAPRTDRRQKPPRLVHDQQEKRAFGWFFQAFEQGVGGALFQHIGGIEDHRAPRSQRGPGHQTTLHLAHLIDADVALGGIGAAIVALFGFVVVGG